jgi:membrane carboxypeptidase/penicillin-binding protein
MGFTRPVAGKTGTTSRYNDAGSAALRRKLLSLVWIGFDQPQPPPDGPEDPLNFQEEETGPRLTGAVAALPIWTEVHDRGHRGPSGDRVRAAFRISCSKKSMPRPDWSQTVTAQAGWRKLFVEGTQPTEGCGSSPVVAEGFFSRVKHWMRLE